MQLSWRLRVRPAGRRKQGLRLAGIVLLAAMSTAGQETIEEHQLKSAFVYNIAKFVEWPAGAFASPGEPLVGCILGDSPIGAVLEEAARNRMIHDRKLAVRFISDARRTEGCHFVFVSSSAQKLWQAALPSAPLGSVLTIGESDALKGVIVNLQLDGDKIHIQIDLEAARRAKLQISSKLLSLSEIVGR